MSRIEKTIFLSYRRSSVVWARAVFQNLKGRGYDVFFDFDGIGCGDFEQAILENIAARAHFVVLLTPGALDRCTAPDDWLRREIETALRTHRNIVPLLLDGFDFGSANLPESIEALGRYDGLRVPVDYFEEGLGRLCDKFLSVPLDAVLHPPSTVAVRAAEQQQEAARALPIVTPEELLEAQRPLYLFEVKVQYRDELLKIEGTHAEQPFGPPSLVIYDQSSIVAQFASRIEYWSRQTRLPR